MQLSRRPEPHNPIDCFRLPNGKSDVFLRRNETTETDEEGNTIYIAEEVYFQSDESLGKEFIEENFETLWNKAENPESEPTPEEEYRKRVEVLEEDNAFLLYDSMEKDVKISGLEQSNAELTYMIMMGGA